MDEKKQHWEKVYTTKTPQEVSWTQATPSTSLDFIHHFDLPKNASIIDVGGGDSVLVDFLLAEGYHDITVLDISEKALEKARTRLGSRAAEVKWIVCDVTAFLPERHYDVWHDRATFHFLTTHEDIDQYLTTARKSVEKFMIIGTFSENGPEKCSGLHIRQYSETELQAQLSAGFEKIKCIHEDHLTPFDTKQNFLFCSFKRHENQIQPSPLHPLH